MRVMVDYVSDEGPCCEYATTLGAGGMFIRTDTPLPGGSMLKVRFRLLDEDDDSNEFIEMEARVAWSQQPIEDEPSRDPGMGLEFTDRAAVAELSRKLERLP